MIIHLLAVLLGAVAGLRSVVPPVAVSWAAHLGLLDLDGSWLAPLGYPWTPWILSVAALCELVTDQLPSTASRTVPLQFSGRILSGVLAGAAIGMSRGDWVTAAVAGVIGAVIGTLAGKAFRARLAVAFGRDRPAAIVEDVVAIAAALLILSMLP